MTVSSARTRIPCNFPDCPRTFHYNIEECFSRSRNVSVSRSNSLAPVVPQEDKPATYKDPNFVATRTFERELEPGQAVMHMVFSGRNIDSQYDSILRDDPTADLVPCDSSITDRDDRPMFVVGDSDYIKALSSSSSGNYKPMSEYRVQRIARVANGEQEWGAACNDMIEKAQEKYDSVPDSDLIEDINSRQHFSYHPALVELASRRAEGHVPLHLEINEGDDNSTGVRITVR